MNINGRFLLLILVVGLFVRLWTTNDHGPWPRGQSRAYRSVTTDWRRGKQPPVARSIAVSSSVASAWQVMPHPQRALAIIHERQDVPAIEVWTPANSQIPLPDGLAAGSYQVVSDQGQVSRLEIATPVNTAAMSDRPTAITDIPTVKVDSVRWFFIRLQPNKELPPSATAAATATTPATALQIVGSAPVELVPIRPAETAIPESTRSPCLNRKFDFTGFIDQPVSESIITVD